ncbi:MAG TPA: carboxylating nicotinate-nucleotide diphosphorylase [Terriglobia bacterium]|nr:carboxylating nicotinate-nucleotide diphosphorylase [Terriglobia bacterium]
MINLGFVDPIIQSALEEDLGAGDLTTQAVVDPELHAEGRFYAKEDLVLAGWPVATRIFCRLSSQIDMEAQCPEGCFVSKGTMFGVVRGTAASLLAGERIALNFLQRLSGIATLTHRFVEHVTGTGVVILDTRKTTPGLRLLEKYAVRVGGGKNHRFGLYDGVLIKDNHIVAAGGIREAILRARNRIDHLKKIEVEVKTFDELEEALDAGAEMVLLDNMPVSQVQEAVRRNSGRALLEVSGGVNLGNVRDYALTGVQFISVGALTHSARAVDINLELKLS